MTWVRLAVLPLAVFVLAGCLHPGQRYLHVRVERDGVPILQTEYAVSDSLDAAGMWKSLEGKPFKVVGTTTPEAIDRQRAVLKGNIKIVILHVDQVMASARVNAVGLVRAPDAEGQWVLPPEEVERTARAAGL